MKQATFLHWAKRSATTEFRKHDSTKYGTSRQTPTRQW